MQIEFNNFTVMIHLRIYYSQAARVSTLKIKDKELHFKNIKFKIYKKINLEKVPFRRSVVQKMSCMPGQSRENSDPKWAYFELI